MSHAKTPISVTFLFWSTPLGEIQEPRFLRDAPCEIIKNQEFQGIDFVSKLRYDVLCDGTALSHFHSALFGRNERIRKQSRFMFSLWMDDFSEGLSVLCNILPDIFYNILTERSTGPTSVPLPGEGMATDLSPKWERFFLALQHDHYHAKLVWNESCRKELRVRLENEIISLEKGRATSIHILMKSNDDSMTVD